MLAIGFAALAGEGDTCRDCQEPRRQKARPADEMRLRPGCVDAVEAARTSKLSDTEVDRYCRWIVRAERTGANRAVHIPSPDDKQIEATLSTLKLVQPPQYLDRLATVLAMNEAGRFVVVRLEKTQGENESEEWRIMDVVEPATKNGASR